MAKPARVPVVLAAVVLTVTLATRPTAAQEWRGRISTHLQYLEARSLALDSVPISQTSGSGRTRTVGDTLVSCGTGATHCFFYRPGGIRSTAPVVQDLDVSVWGAGVQGLRAYASARTRTAFGDDEFWPRTDDHFDLLYGYVELDRPRFRARLGRDVQVSGLGYYGYDGGSILVRFREPRAEIEAYGGWGLERGLPEPVNSDALASLEEFQPLERNHLFGFRGSARPMPGASIELIYQREIQTDRSGLASERVALDAAYAPSRDVRLRGHADYDLATGWWGKAGATVGWSLTPEVQIEARLFRYRPVFSLQTIWAAFSPTPYTGWGLAVGGQPLRTVSLRLWGERRDYADTDAEVPFQVTTDRTWRAGASARFSPSALWDIEGSYELNYTFGSASSAGAVRVSARPHERWTLGVRGSGFQQLGEFRVGEGRVWSVGGDVRWRMQVGTAWLSVDRYRHDRRESGPPGVDWTQTRAAAGLAVYVGSEPGRAP